MQTTDMHHPFHDELIADLSLPAFQHAFRQYFTELDIHVSDWDGLFREMAGQADNAAFLRTAPEGAAVGFLQFCPITFPSCFL